MGAKNNSAREKGIREIAEVVYAENKKRGLPADPIRDWRKAEEIYDDKITYLFYWKSARFIKRNFYKLTATGILLIVLFSIEDFKMRKDLTDLRDRPYLSVDLINPLQIDDADTNSTYYGNYIVLRNTGKTPAANVILSYFMTTEIDNKKATGQKWSDQKAEGISILGFVAPGALVKEPGFRSLSPAASFYYFEMIASYQGLNPSRRYWTHIKRTFKIDKETKNLLPILTYAEWDKNRDFTVPAFSADKGARDLFARTEKR